jgi:uncharacterized protein YecT (DUF1311 family)
VRRLPGRPGPSTAPIPAMSAGWTAAVALSVTALCGPSPSRAEAFDTCIARSDGVSAAMLDCGAQEIARWDLRLNAAYRILMEALPPPARARLQIEERAWLGHHRAETRRLADAPDNGSAAFLASQAFELADLQQRTQDLERRAGLAGGSGGPPRPPGASPQPVAR